MADNHRVQLNDLEEEEARIMRELRALDEEENVEEAARRRREESVKEDPQAAFVSLLLECEKEVRDAKGYIADEGPPLKIVRVRVGETAPKGATFLSRPRGTGVDFTVPVTMKSYTDLIKKPIFLNQIRDKIKGKAYNSSEDYLDDMRLLARNTATFNTGPELSWVVQHARFLLEAAEDAVTTRSKFFFDIEDAARQSSGTRHKGASANAGGKRKRGGSHAAEKANADVKGIPAVGAIIEVYWPTYRRWFLATVTERSGSNVRVLYDEDNTDQWVNLEHGLKWRMRNARAAAATAGKQRRAQEQPAPKRRKSSADAVHADAGSVVVAGASAEDLDAVKVELSSKLEDIKESMTDVVTGHLEHLDAKLMRSDVLQRVLLAVQDCQVSVEEKIAAIEEKHTRLEQKLDALSRKLNRNVIAELSASAAEKPEAERDPVSDLKDASTGLGPAADASGEKLPTLSGKSSEVCRTEPEVIDVDDNSSGKQPVRDDADQEMTDVGKVEGVETGEDLSEEASGDRQGTSEENPGDTTENRAEDPAKRSSGNDEVMQEADGGERSTEKATDSSGKERQVDGGTPIPAVSEDVAKSTGPETADTDHQASEEKPPDMPKSDRLPSKEHDVSAEGKEGPEGDRKGAEVPRAEDPAASASTEGGLHRSKNSGEAHPGGGQGESETNDTPDADRTQSKKNTTDAEKSKLPMENQDNGEEMKLDQVADGDDEGSRKKTDDNDNQSSDESDSDDSNASDSDNSSDKDETAKPAQRASEGPAEDTGITFVEAKPPSTAAETLPEKQSNVEKGNTEQEKEGKEEAPPSSREQLAEATAKQSLASASTGNDSKE